MIASIRTAQQAMVEPSADVQAKVDAWDPDRRARSISHLTTNRNDLLNRPVFGARPAEWLDLEDKLAIEELWAAAGIPVAPSLQVPTADHDGLIDAHHRMATELGTVWAGDNTMGWHGGGEGTFWVLNAETAADMAERLSGYENVRIMPFLEGIPCSIHGMVLPAEPDRYDDERSVAVFRPCELMMLRNPVAKKLYYGRVGSYWDPAPADRLEMQDVARRVGLQLRRAVGYRGAFTVDGIMSVDGFRPTEVNTRYGAALASKMETVSGQPIELFHVHMALIDGLLDGIDLQPLEHWVTANLDAARRFAGFLTSEQAPETERTAEIRRRPDGTLTVTETTEGANRADGSTEQPALAEARWGTAPIGGLILIQARDGIPVGPPTAPLLVEISGALNAAWGIDSPALVAACQVR